ncbi:acyl-CoA thioesterase [Salinibacillus xinjiangensis]|uniref:Acyl-CoA thioesterase n=1 Tax=Salinibacillus xinjiangensis TaxID=1229268 RepID=A0A6G1XBQ9_9BACI|nr:thioesterase family protein [Salinibacillus xinjiangensis]MRG88377.1 acyl-CoA thioesterase [Salinibacillus xinjiangensis]
MKKVNYVEDVEAWIDGFTFYIPVKIRFSETDMFGHVNNISPFIYFEEARIAYLEHIGLFRDFKEDGSQGIPVVADLQCDYHRQIFFEDRLKLYVKTNQVGRTSLDIHYLGVNQKEEICVTGRGRLVHIDPNTGKPIPFDDRQKQIFTEKGLL